MLTEAEIEWLERRKKLCARCEWNLYGNPCVRHGRDGETGKCKGFEPRNVGSDAAEFEAKVQKWLMYQYEKAFQCKEVSGGFMPSRETMLMFARLAAEAEMDAKSNRNDAIKPNAYDLIEQHGGNFEDECNFKTPESDLTDEEIRYDMR